MAAVTRSDAGVRVTLEPEETDVLNRLVEEMGDVLADEGLEDPVTERLFPSAHDEPEEDAKFRELVGDQLRSGKAAALDVVKDTLSLEGATDAVIEKDQVHAWLTVVTDIRLALGTRLEITEDDYARGLDPDDPKAPALAVFHWLAWLQESMLEAMMDTDEG